MTKHLSSACQQTTDSLYLLPAHLPKAHHSCPAPRHRQQNSNQGTLQLQEADWAEITDNMPAVPNTPDGKQYVGRK